MALFPSRKRKEHSFTPSEGERSLASSMQEEILDWSALPLQDPWYTTSLLFPKVAHGANPLSPQNWIFSRKLGFASSAQVPDPNELSDLEIK